MRVAHARGGGAKPILAPATRAVGVAEALRAAGRFVAQVTLRPARRARPVTRALEPRGTRVGIAAAAAADRVVQAAAVDARVRAARDVARVAVASGVVKAVRLDSSCSARAANRVCCAVAPVTVVRVAAVPTDALVAGAVGVARARRAGLCARDAEALWHVWKRRERPALEAGLAVAVIRTGAALADRV